MFKICAERRVLLDNVWHVVMAYAGGVPRGGEILPNLLRVEINDDIRTKYWSLQFPFTSEHVMGALHTVKILQPLLFLFG